VDYAGFARILPSDRPMAMSMSHSFPSFFLSIPLRGGGLAAKDCAQTVRNRRVPRGRAWPCFRLLFSQIFSSFTFSLESLPYPPRSPISRQRGPANGGAPGPTFFPPIDPCFFFLESAPLRRPKMSLALEQHFLSFFPPLHRRRFSQERQAPSP